MTSLLDNELVRKYFYWDGIDCDGAARRILEAMQQPIKKGDRWLLVLEDYSIREEIAQFDTEWSHMHSLRLPDRFQKQESCKSHWCEGCNQYLAHKYDPKPTPEPEKCKDELEKKIKQIRDDYHDACIDFPSCDLEIELRKLVALARKS